MKKEFSVLALAVAAAFTSCSKSQKKDNTPQATPVTVAKAEKEFAVYYDQFPATVVALEQVELRAQVSGYLTGIYFKEGEVVPKGKILYEIDKRLYEAALNQAQANVLSAQANLYRAQKDAERYTQLAKQDAVAKQLLDNAIATLETSKSQVAVAQAAVTTARTNLGFSVIRAPFTGKIGLSQVKLGAQIGAGTTLLNTISSENPIAVDFVIDESKIPRFNQILNHKTQSDSTFKVQFSNGDSYPHYGTISVIDRGVNDQTGTIRIRVRFPNPKNTLIDGMSCVLKVLNQQSGEQILIPTKAMTEQMGEYFVFVDQGDTVAKQQKISIGPKIKEKIIVLNGIKEGEKVITEGINRLQNGSKITLGKPQAPAANSKQQAAK